MSAALMLGGCMAMMAQAAPPASGTAPVGPSPRPPAVLLKPGIEILHSQPVAEGAMIVWTVQVQGQASRFYAPPNGKILLSGSAWDGQSGTLLQTPAPPVPLPPSRPAQQAPLPASAGPASPLATTPASNVPGAAPTMQAAQVPGSTPWSGAVPEAIDALSRLQGIQEGRGRPADTVYVVFDPRCPYCHLAYQRLRPHVRQGAVVRWIPVSVLGDEAQGHAQIAGILQAANPSEALRLAMQKQGPSTTPKAATLEAMQRNRAFFLAAARASMPDTPPGVPMAFFLDKRTGKPRMLAGLSETIILNDIFGR